MEMMEKEFIEIKHAIKTCKRFALAFLLFFCFEICILRSPTLFRRPNDNPTLDTLHLSPILTHNNLMTIMVFNCWLRNRF